MLKSLLILAYKLDLLKLTKEFNFHGFKPIAQNWMNVNCKCIIYELFYLFLNNMVCTAKLFCLNPPELFLLDCCCLGFFKVPNYLRYKENTASLTKVCPKVSIF